MLRRSEYKLLNQMLDEAISGEFEEYKFDESELSKLQTKLYQYLNQQTIAAEKVSEEKSRIEELVTNISHQVKTPLTNIMMYSELLEESARDDQQEYVSQIYNQSRKLNELMQALVKVSRLETGIFVFEQRTDSLAEVAEEAIRGNISKATGKHIVIRKMWDASDDSTILACIDKKWAIEAASNIIDNAIKYSPENSEIEVDMLEHEMFAGIKITDHGIGISEHESPKVFSRFYRSSSVHDEKGIGVGLFLARQIVEEQGGYIRLKSELGKGSCFEIYFPKRM
ncbi:MAG: HAMP domain-containing histidine kinase [Lachnospiraceae bacterium]|nr:HAMP domain-containing histidine kinase [Lachnospiraceae bacterium]